LPALAEAGKLDHAHVRRRHSPLALLEWSTDAVSVQVGCVPRNRVHRSRSVRIVRCQWKLRALPRVRRRRRSQGRCWRTRNGFGGVVAGGGTGAVHS
jgi:hypothetical protein